MGSVEVPAKMMNCNSLSCRNASCFTCYTKAQQLVQSALLLVSILPLLVSLCPCWSQFCPFWSLFPPADLSFLPVLGHQPCAIHLPNVRSLMAIFSLHDCSQTVHKSSLDSKTKQTLRLINNLLLCPQCSSVSPPFMTYNNIASVTA